MYIMLHLSVQKVTQQLQEQIKRGADDKKKDMATKMW